MTTQTRNEEEKNIRFRLRKFNYVSWLEHVISATAATAATTLTIDKATNYLFII